MPDNDESLAMAVAEMESTPGAPTPEAPETTAETGSEVTPQAPLSSWELDHPEDGRVKFGSKEALEWYNHHKNLQTFGKERESFELERRKMSGELDEYNRYKSWAQQNPGLYQQILQEIDARMRGEAPQQVVGDNGQVIPPQLLQRIEAIEGRIAEERKQAEFAKDDADMEAGIQAVQKKYPDFKLDALDSTGNSLLVRVLQHMKENGYTRGKDFEYGFRSYILDSAIEQAKMSGRQGLQKDIEKRQRTGVASTAPAGRNPISRPVRNAARLTDEEALENAVADANAMGGLA